MSLRVIKPGLATTVQDLGRTGFRGFGVPQGGAFDRASLRLANALVGNEPNCAALELTMIGGQYRAEANLALALAGAPFSAKLDCSGQITYLTLPQSFTMRMGDQLILGGSPRGLRAYMAVRGGWLTPSFLESRSCEDRLQSGRCLSARPGTIAVRRPATANFFDPSLSRIQLIDGPDGCIPPILLDQPFLVEQSSDRIGIRLLGPPLLDFEMPDRRSSPVALGAVQVAGTQPIILGVAGGTMGGYPHIAHVISADLDRLAQARPGDALRFARIELQEARLLDRQYRQELDLRDRIIALGAAETTTRNAN